MLFPQTIEYHTDMQNSGDPKEGDSEYHTFYSKPTFAETHS